LIKKVILISQNLRGKIMKNNKVNVDGLASRISDCYKENGTILEGVQEYSIYEYFKSCFKEYVNPQLMELKLLKKRQYFFIFSSFSEPGNVFGNSSQLFSIQNLNSCINIARSPTFEDIEVFFSYGLDERIIAETGLGNAYLINPLLQQFLKSHSFLYIEESKKNIKFELESKCNENFRRKMYINYTR
jgi:hypothetical protein